MALYQKRPPSLSACDHSHCFAGMCAACGKHGVADMSCEIQLPPRSKTPRRVTTAATAETLMPPHGVKVSIVVTPSPSLPPPSNDALDDGRLLLVLDLDHTLLHTTTVPIDATAAAASDINRLDCGGGGGGGVVYHCKFRPGLRAFLRRMHRRFQLHIYTAATRAYAVEVLSRLDPDGMLFGGDGRIVTRDDVADGDTKCLSHMFPEEESGRYRRVLIVDDRIEVWPFQRNHLLPVTPYHYFIGQDAMPASAARERRSRAQLDAIATALEAVHCAFTTAKGNIYASHLLSAQRSCVLGGLSIAFDRKRLLRDVNPLWRPAEMYGAVCTVAVDSKTTHLIARGLTPKVRTTVARFPAVHIVTKKWLLDSIDAFARRCELVYSVL